MRKQEASDRHRVTQTGHRQPEEGHRRTHSWDFGQGFDFDACMGAGMKFEKEYTDSKKQKAGNSAPDFMNVNASFPNSLDLIQKNEKERYGVGMKYLKTIDYTY